MSEVNPNTDNAMASRRPTNDISDIPGCKPAPNVKPLHLDNPTPAERMSAAGTGALTANQLRLSCIGYNLINNRSFDTRSGVGSASSRMSSFGYPTAGARRLDVRDINGPKLNCYGRPDQYQVGAATLSADSGSMPVYAGVRKDIPIG